MHAKLADFLKFKAQSKQLSRQFAAIATSKKGAPPIDTGSDSDNSPTAEAAKKKRASVLSPQGNNKVTFDYNGKLIQVKDPKLENAQKLINPEVYIKGQGYS